jgi:hypothetical protein
MFCYFLKQFTRSYPIPKHQAMTCTSCVTIIQSHTTRYLRAKSEEIFRSSRCTQMNKPKKGEGMSEQLEKLKRRRSDALRVAARHNYIVLCVVTAR